MRKSPEMVLQSAWARAEQLDNMSRPGRELYREDVPPMQVVEHGVRSVRYVPALFALGWMCAVAVVYDKAKPHRVTCVGTEHGAALFGDTAKALMTARKKSEGAQYAEAARLCAKAIPRVTWEGRMHRMRLLDLQHRVCELYPKLRVWREGGRQPWQDEVWLHRTHGGQHAGGCLWIREYYTTGTCLSDFGWRV